MPSNVNVDEPKFAEIHLGYFKQGDDLSSFLTDSNNNVIDALERHSEAMKSVSDHLSDVAQLLKKHRSSIGQVKIHADTHMIEISAPPAIIDELVDQELAFIPEYEDSDCEEDTECNEEESTQE